jgi:hypothetical protein
VRQWILAVGILAVTGFGIWYGLELRARNWEGKWRTFVNDWEKKGESFGVDKNLPAAMADEDEFASHPWIRRIAAEDPNVLKRLREMEPETVAGYAAWQATEAVEDVAAPMPVELAERLRAHAAGFRQELDAFADALLRPGGRLNSVDEKGSPTFSGWVNQLTPLSHLLEGISHAAIAMDDSAAFTEAIEISLRAGEKLRASNVMLPVVVGCGFESAAYQSLRSVPVPTVWPRSEPLKWVAALDLRRRNLADEYVAAARAERGLFLGLFAELEKASAGGGTIPRWGPFRRVFLARAKLEPCEAMQGMLLALGGKPVDLGQIARFEAYAADKRHKNDPALEFGLWMLVGVRRGIHEALLQQESDRAAIREKLLEAR